VKQPQDYTTAGAMQFSVELGASLFAAPLVFRRIRIPWYRPSFANVADSYRQGWPLFLSGSALFISGLSTPIILGTVGRMAEVGYFSAADKLIKASISALNPLSQALFPHIVSARRESAASALRLIRKSLLATTALSMTAAPATFLLAAPLCRLFFGVSFQRSIPILQCLVPLPVLFGLLTVFGTQTMLVFNMDSTLTKIMFASAIVGLPLTTLLSVRFGAIGAAAASDSVAILIASAIYFCLRSKGVHVWRDQSRHPPMTPA
jgi:PST family polysaccharide transporter